MSMSTEHNDDRERTKLRVLSHVNQDTDTSSQGRLPDYLLTLEWLSNSPVSSSLSAVDKYKVFTGTPPKLPEQGYEEGNVAFKRRDMSAQLRKENTLTMIADTRQKPQHSIRAESLDTPCTISHYHCGLFLGSRNTISSQVLISAAVLADGSHSSAATHTPEQKSDMDTEMTCPLTLKDDHSIRSGSSSPIQLDTMSSFQSVRERNIQANTNLSRQGRSHSLAQGPSSGTIRRPEMASSLPSASFIPPGQYDPNAPTMSSPPSNRGSFMLGENSIPLSTVCPGAVWPTNDQVDTAYAYGIRRDDGSFTRLLCADEFPTAGVPPRQGPEGLIVLPAPMQRAPNPNLPDRMVPTEVVQKLPPVDFVPQRPGLSLRPGSFDSTQHIDSIVQSSTSSLPPRRREKIFCDKWIHEGVCAFTQMGCKYKHEMPLDRATQLTLGLNHGIPSWYRRSYALTLRPSSPPMPPMYSPPSSGKRTEGPWRRLEGLPPKMGNNSNNSNSHNPGTQSASMGGGMHSGPRSENRSAFGPIGPPQTQNQNASSRNPYLALKVEEAENGDEDEMVYKGRNR
ncbi:hypothetical protein BKA65DRAFT_476239 [Rhexocercosporidium sp. MPI-PUGE-AT-0058]|nr:hypothetical protein BKA65DRAFT_476239 [Rhexocercosporidium sp. MPI-PUGE-AT-0058]